MVHSVTVLPKRSQFEVKCSCGFVSPAMNLKDGNRIGMIHIRGEVEKEKQHGT